MLHYSRSQTVGYIRILELEGIGKGKLAAALDEIGRDFKDFSGFIIDIRDCPGGDDSTAIAIINRFTDQKRVAFHRKTKTGPGDDDFSPLRPGTSSLRVMRSSPARSRSSPMICVQRRRGLCARHPQSALCDDIGDHTNGVFSYTLDKDLPNGWEYCLSYQVYMSPDMICYEGKGIPVDIELHNSKADITNGVDPLITRALEVLASKGLVASR